MRGLNLIKLAGLIVGAVLLNVIILSPGLIGVTIGDSALATASGVTLLVVSLLVVLYGSYVLLIKPPFAKPVKDIRSYEDYAAVLSHYRKVKGLANEVVLALDQLERMGKKKRILLDILNQRFDPAELSYRRFVGVTEEVEKLFYLHIRGILNKLSIIDAAGLAIAVRQAYINHVTAYIERNEEILLKLDQLLLEISRLNHANDRNLEELPGIKEIDELIKQTKFYME